MTGDCLRCRRPETAKIHDTFGRQGTGGAAVHAFIGDREAAILQYAAAQLGWAGKSKAHAHHQPPEFVIWNEALEKARVVVTDLAAPIDPQELADYDKYLGPDETESTALTKATRFTFTLETRTVVVRGVLEADISNINAASAWADLVEKFEALGIRVTPADEEQPTHEDTDGTILNGKARP